ncbi:hypothetical protein AVEN_84470-1 [Araneus ventricosus]|uniref:Tc1-like transposase DDE domain-containing protein n=1 Tax=Araneus ventricosus TaxID=182803 RepID=A0A4Y2P8Z8_ARAVE|nr:hypothetical protein AVEN_84470-1 [Araneus ventricosus]
MQILSVKYVSVHVYVGGACIETGLIRCVRGAVGPEFILIDDNVRPHRTLLVDEFLESEDIRRMDWPARSPDLNPIEHVWDDLARAIATHNPLPEPSRK